jgi:hypothetical protein
VQFDELDKAFEKIEQSRSARLAWISLVYSQNMSFLATSFQKASASTGAAGDAMLAGTRT